MPKTLQSIMAEDSALKPTSATTKQGWLWLASVMIGTTICVPVFQFGAMLGNQLAFWPFFVGIFLGGFIAGAMATPIALIGQKTGLTSSLLIQQTFGHNGYQFANLAFILACIGWFGIQTGVFANAFVATANQLWGLQLSFPMVALLSGLLMTTTAMVGFRGIGKLSYIAVPLLLILMLSPLVMLLMELGMLPILAKTSAIGAPTIGMIASMVAGAYSAAQMPDFSRFMQTPSDAVKGTIVNHMLVYPALLLLTGALAMLSGGSDLLTIMLALNFGVLTLVVLFMSTWSTNDANVYSAALSLNPVFKKLQRWHLAALSGVLGSVAAAFGIFDHFMSWLIMLGVVFSPIAGVMWADYLLNPQHYTPKQFGKAAAVRPEPLSAWLLGTLVGYCVTPATDFGGGLLTLSGIPALDSFVAGAAILYIFNQYYKKA